jgi:copper chaperone
MVTKTFSVPNISCNHCVMTIKRELNALDCVSSVEGDAAQKKITVTFKSDSDLAKIRETLDEIGYPIAS